MSLIADHFLQDRLAGLHPTLGVTGVFEVLAPRDQDYPFVTYQQQASIDVGGVGPNSRIMLDTDYIVRAISRTTTYDTLRPIAQAIDTLLEGVSGPVYGLNQDDEVVVEGEVLAVVRRSEYRLVEQLEGRQVRHFGGVYRIQTIGS